MTTQRKLWVVNVCTASLKHFVPVYHIYSVQHYSNYKEEVLTEYHISL